MSNDFFKIATEMAKQLSGSNVDLSGAGQEDAFKKLLGDGKKLFDSGVSGGAAVGGDENTTGGSFAGNAVDNVRKR